MELIEEPVEDGVDSPELAGIIGFRLSIVRADGPALATQEKWSKRI